MNKRILIFSLSYFPMVGGAEVALKEITDRLGEIEFDLVTLRFHKTDAAFERIGNVNVYRLGGGWGYLSKILFIPEAAAFAWGRQYDAYWAMMTYMLFPVSLARMLGKKTPYILTLQDGDPVEHVFKRWFIWPFRPLISYGFKHARKVQAISRFLAEWSRRADAVVIPNGVNIERFSAHPAQVSKNHDEVVLITTSRLVEKNAVGDIIEALAFLPEHVKLKVLGTGPLERSLKLKAASLQLGNRVEFVGFVEQKDIPTHLHKADIFVRPSLSEGQGISFIEAMAAGLPVIATPVGGIPDFLKDGETGLFVEPKNPRLIAFQVQKLMSDRVLRDKIIINAKRMVMEKYDWDLIAREMKERVFDPVL